MSTPVLATKLYIPPPRPNVVSRPRLIERLNEGLQGKLTLISASAGFGKTTLLSEWISTLTPGPSSSSGRGEGVRAAWLSLDEGDNDPTRFLAYLVMALQTIAANIGKGVLAVLQAPQPPPAEMVLTALLNEITTVPDSFSLVLDDYHVIEAQPVDEALAFLLEHLPPQMHLVIATREDPQLPLARLRARGQLAELRAADLRFTLTEAADFLNQVMGLNLSGEDIAALETRTEGWVAGLQLAALSMQGHKDAASFIRSFTGSHRFVLDYLVEEVLQQQPPSIQTFLLRTSILDRLCGPLCDAVCSAGTAVMLDPTASGQETLEYLERVNLFIVPLDNERHWYRYHHLFADLLRRRLHQSIASSATRDEAQSVAGLHSRASQWYEDSGLELEAFHHAAAANDIERAERLIEGKGMPLHFRGAMAPVLSWLGALPQTVLDARPSLWVTYASALMLSGHPSGVEQKLQAAEAALAAAARQGAVEDDKTRNLLGHIAATRALLASSQNQVEIIIAQSRRALEYLHPGNLAVRTAATLTLGIAYQLQGNRAAASQAYTEVISISQASGNFMFTLAAASALGNIQLAENQLHLAAETYQYILQIVGDPAQWTTSEAHFGLARIFYEWNDLDAAELHGQQYVRLAPQIECDTYVSGEVLLARLKLARGDVAGAAAILAQADQFARQHNFTDRMLEVAAAQVLTLLRQGNLAAATHLAETHELPISQAQVHLAQGDAPAALAVLAPLRQQVEAKGCTDEQLKVMVLQAVAHHAHGEKDKAVRLLGEALALAEPGGFIRLFVDEGLPMAALLQEAAKHGTAPNYVSQLQAALREAEDRTPVTQRLIEPLSERELEVLRLLGTELGGPEIARELRVSLNTLRTHTKNIYTKLWVNNRRAAVRRADELNLL